MNADKTLTRRNFLWTLGSGSAIVIAGFFTGKLLSADDKNYPPTAAMPQLIDCKRTENNEQTVLTFSDYACTVNRTGDFITRLLDGQNTLDEICRKVAEHYSMPRTDELNTSVTLFICSLSQANMLKSPFYATIYESYA
jgi:hypothetical protein